MSTSLESSSFGGCGSVSETVTTSGTIPVTVPEIGTVSEVAGDRSPCSDCGARAASVLGDQRGAVILLGIAAGAVLTFALFNLVRVGDAVLWRENLQNAADAAALDDSILHARGMNLLVYLNLLMALVMSVLVMWRILGILLAIAIVVVGVACGFTGVACGALVKLGDWTQKYIRTDPKVSGNVVKICAGINVVEKVVSTVVPPYAMGHAMIKTRVSYPVDSVFALAPSIGTPTLLSQGTTSSDFRGTFLEKNSIREQITRCFQKKTPTTPPTPTRYSKAGAAWDGVAQRRMGMIFSLPVQEGEIDTLCSEAGQFFDKTLPALITGDDSVDLLGVVGDVKNQIISSFPELFCMPAQAGASSLTTRIANKLKSQVDSGCDKQSKQFDAEPPEQRSKNQYNDGNGKFDMEKCKTGANQALAENKTTTTAGAAQVMSCVQPAEVWSVTQNGHVLLQSFSWANKKPNLSVPYSTIRAQAEMYFDCEGAWTADCQSIAMWRPRWRARLRRVLPMREILKELAQVGLNFAVDSVTDVISNNFLAPINDAVGAAESLPLPDQLKSNTPDKLLEKGSDKVKELAVDFLGLDPEEDKKLIH